MRRLLYIAAKKIIGGFGRLYTYWVLLQSKVNFGYLYNWYAATDPRNITSEGWRVCTLEDFENGLRAYAGGYSVAGGKLREVGTEHWATTIGATNIFGFNGRGSGLRNDSGEFQALKLALTFYMTHPNPILKGTYEVINVGSDSVGGATENSGRYGCAIRAVRDTTTLTHGQIGTYIQNDGLVLPTICIGTQEWVSCNLAETKFRNGDLITKVTDNTAWANLESEGYCAFNNDEANAIVTTSIAPEGWRIPTTSEAVTLFLDWQLVERGDALTEPNLKFWDYIYTANNSSKFSARGAGVRSGSTGEFQFFKTHNRILVSDNDDGSTCSGIEINNVNGYMAASINIGTWLKKAGFSLRFIKDDGIDPGTVTDFEGNIYKTVKIGNQVWTAESWKCRKYNDGTPILNVTDNTAWSLLNGEGAYCEVENDIKNS